MGPTTQVQGETPCSPKTFCSPRDGSPLLGFMKRCLPSWPASSFSPSGRRAEDSKSLSQGPGRRCLEGAELHQRRRPRLRGDLRRQEGSAPLEFQGANAGHRGLQRGDLGLHRALGLARIPQRSTRNARSGAVQDWEIRSRHRLRSRQRTRPPDPHRRTGSGLALYFTRATPRGKQQFELHKTVNPRRRERRLALRLRGPG